MSNFPYASMRIKAMPDFTYCGDGTGCGIFPAMKRKMQRKADPALRFGEAPKVLVSISLAHASWRDFFSGILRYVDERANWDLRIAHEPGDLSAEQIDEAERGGYAGIILATPGNIDFDRLNRSTLPLAACGGWPELQCRKRNVVHVGLDSAACGTVGAKHLLARGRYAVYGFVRSRFDKDWSYRRQEAFAQTILASGGTVARYILPDGAVQGKDLGELCAWISSLPKPAAVMADCDRRAAQVIAACRNYVEKTGRRVIFEYALTDEKNCEPRHAEELARRLRGLQCHVNLIPLNPVKERGLKGVTEEQVKAFLSVLEREHISATRRREMGDDIEGACGQLRRRYLEENRLP